MKHLQLFENFDSGLEKLESAFNATLEKIVDTLPHGKVHEAIKDAAEAALIKLGDVEFTMYTIDGYFSNSLGDDSDILTNLMLALTEFYFEYEDGAEPYGGWKVTVKNGAVTYEELAEEDWD